MSKVEIIQLPANVSVAMKIFTVAKQPWGMAVARFGRLATEFATHALLTCLNKPNKIALILG